MKPRIPKIIRRDFLRKLVAVFFALLIWYAVESQLHEFVTFHDVPVTLRHPSDKMVLERRTITASVTVRGARRRLEDIQSNDVSISVVVPVVPEGVYYYDLHLSLNDVKTPPGVRVASIDPENVRIQLDRILTKEVPVKVRETGTLSYGYRVSNRKIVPSAVNVSGPSRILQEVKEIPTEPVVLDETIAHSFEVEVPLIPLPPFRIHPSTVHIGYEIIKHSGQRAFLDLPIRVLSIRNAPLTPAAPLPRASITVRGPKLDLDELKATMIHPFVDISGISQPGQYRLPVRVWMDNANRLDVEMIHPPEVEINLIANGNTPPPTATPPTVPAAVPTSGGQPQP